MLEETAKAANIVGSVQEYIVTELSGTFPAATALDFGGGVKFNDEGLAEWLQVRMMEPARAGGVQHAPPDSQDSFAHDIFWLVNLNIFVRPARLVPFNNLRLWVLRDIVINRFHIGCKIPVQSYINDNAFVGHLYCDEVIADRPVTDPLREADLIQHNIVASFHWIEVWNPTP